MNFNLADTPMSLRVAFARNPPDAFANCRQFPTLHPTTSCPFPGWCVEVSYFGCDGYLKWSTDHILCIIKKTDNGVQEANEAEGGKIYSLKH